MRTEEEMDRINTIEELKNAVIEKFSYGWTELDDLRIQVPKQFNVKEVYKINFLRYHHILMRFELIEDFVNVMGKKVHYISAKNGYSYQI